MSRKIVLYTAVSLDGYIAKKNDSLDWLHASETEGDDNGFQEFYDTIDTVLVGRRTYDQVILHHPDEPPFEDKECYVFSRSVSGTEDNAKFVNEDIVEFTKKLKETDGGNIWMVGGGEALKPLLEAKLVDEFMLQVTPVILGEGIPLFIHGDYGMRLSLIDMKRYNQFAELHYVLTQKPV